jgi:flagellar biogenesis protein FliO
LQLLMSHWLVIASNHADDHLSRAADHAVLIGVVLLIALVGGLAYGLVRIVAKSRAARPQSDRRPEGAGGPDP